VNLTAVRNALAAQITSQTGLRAAGQAHDSVVVPAAVVVPGNPVITYGATMDGTVTASLVVLVLVSYAVSPAAQQALDAYLGVGGPGTSVPDAIAADPTLGGLVEWAVPVSVSSYGLVQWGGVDYLGARLAVSVGSA
jgi:hypothetical protein